MTASMRVHAVADRERLVGGNCPRYQGVGANLGLKVGAQAAILGRLIALGRGVGAVRQTLGAKLFRTSGLGLPLLGSSRT